MHSETSDCLRCRARLRSAPGISTAQRGASLLSFLLLVALLAVAFRWLLDDYLPASAEDLNAVVALADSSTAARTILVGALKETPNPNRGELRLLRSRMNEVIVTETARAVTGDKTIETPTERASARETQEASRIDQLAAKSWGEMSNEERAALAISRASLAVLVLAVIVGFFLLTLWGWRVMRAAQTGRRNP